MINDLVNDLEFFAYLTLLMISYSYALVLWLMLRRCVRGAGQDGEAAGVKKS